MVAVETHFFFNWLVQAQEYVCEEEAHRDNHGARPAQHDLTNTHPARKWRMRAHDQSESSSSRLWMCRCCLQLYTDEYIFVLSAEDQLRLGLVTPVVPDDVPILSLGVQELSLQRSTFFRANNLSCSLGHVPHSRMCVASRNLINAVAEVYADAPKVHTSKLNATNDTEPESRPDPDSMMFKYNDVTAAVYQEWNIVKKNKFGRRQERIMGVDAHKIYNSKKEGKKAVTAVYRVRCFAFAAAGSTGLTARRVRAECCRRIETSQPSRTSTTCRTMCGRSASRSTTMESL